MHDRDRVRYGTDTRVRAVRNGRTNAEGTGALFEIVTQTGGAQSFWCATGDLPRHAAFLLGLAQFAVRSRDVATPLAESVHLDFAIPEALSFGVGAGPDGGLILAVHIGTEQPMMFAVSPAVLANLRSLLKDGPNGAGTFRGG